MNPINLPVRSKRSHKIVREGAWFKVLPPRCVPGSRFLVPGSRFQVPANAQVQDSSSKLFPFQLVSLWVFSHSTHSKTCDTMYQPILNAIQLRPVCELQTNSCSWETFAYKYSRRWPQFNLYLPAVLLCHHHQLVSQMGFFWTKPDFVKHVDLAVTRPPVIHKCHQCLQIKYHNKLWEIAF